MFRETDYKSLKANLRIDVMAMDDELIQHPSKLQQVCEIAADALQLRDAFKRQLEIEISEAAHRLRVPDGAGKFPAENKIASQVLLDRKVEVANADLEDANHDLRYWQSLVDSTKEKGSSLKRIAELTIAGYLAPNAIRRAEMQEVRTGRIKVNTLMQDAFLFAAKGIGILIVLSIAGYLLGRFTGLGFMKSVRTTPQQRKRNPHG